MNDTNRHHGTGHLGVEPKIFTGEKGGKVAKLFTILNEGYVDRAGTKHESTLPLNLVVLRPSDVAFAETLHKGDAVSWNGKLAMRQFTDKDGKDRTATEIVIAGPGAKLETIPAKVDAEEFGPRQQQATAPAHNQ